MKHIENNNRLAKFSNLLLALWNFFINTIFCISQRILKEYYLSSFFRIFKIYQYKAIINALRKTAIPEGITFRRSKIKITMNKITQRNNIVFKSFLFMQDSPHISSTLDCMDLNNAVHIPEYILEYIAHIQNIPYLVSHLFSMHQKQFCINQVGDQK